MEKYLPFTYIRVTDNSVYFRPINDPLDIIPYEFQNGYSEQSVLEWVRWRLPDDNRQFLAEDCAKRGIRVCGEDILKISHGRVIDDSCWLKQKDGPQTYQELLQCD